MSSKNGNKTEFLYMVGTQDNPTQLNNMFSPKEVSENVIKSRSGLYDGPRLCFAKVPLKIVKRVCEILSVFLKP